MKFRTDFVTNSSDSSFLTFNIKNKKLFEALAALGIRFEHVNEGEFTHYMNIILPSGESISLLDDDGWNLPSFSEMNSISAWIVATILWEIESFEPAKEEEEYSDFAKELINLFNQANITHLDWEAIDAWSRDDMIEEFEKAFGHMDADIEEAEIEHAYGFEGALSFGDYTKIKNGERLNVCYLGDVEPDREECDGLRFVVTGKLKYFENREEIVEFIEDEGGTVTDSISKKTNYLICNDINATSSKMKKAKELGIPLLSEAAFIRRFADPDDFEDLVSEEDLCEEAWNLSMDGGVLDFAVENGTQPLVIEIWQNGRWIAKKDAKK